MQTAPERAEKINGRKRWLARSTGFVFAKEFGRSRLKNLISFEKNQKFRRKKKICA
jgi:hypothetical protein